MPTENERRVLNLLSATDFTPGTDPGKLIESWGNDAVTIVCEAALGSYPALQRKVRSNAVAALETIDRPQAKETLQLLLKDVDSDVSIRALRAAGHQKNDAAVKDISKLLQSPTLPSLVAVEAVKALLDINSSEAKTAIANYVAADAVTLPHRAYSLVKSYLEKVKD